MANENLSRPFLIEFNGQFVVNPRPTDDMAFEGRIPASTGDRRDAAVFKLENGFLLKADSGPMPLHFGRFRIEPLALMPMPVYWIPQRDMVQQCAYIGEESSPETFQSSGFHMGVLPGQENLVRAMPPGLFPGSEMKLHWQ
ncbi:hypothetical protein G6011_11734 [Alternaria panax]|uniref:Uncharacterized protein n=1 Tax=Alternaria panax TaxID=48097 RepID=A0AAD4NTM5_9PLEO|nr:hypothetical protein G6011_11734 [Alternaria panax]